jgi:hypothetical protein
MKKIAPKGQGAVNASLGRHKNGWTAGLFPFESCVCCVRVLSRSNAGATMAQNKTLKNDAAPKASKPTKRVAKIR